MDDDLVVTRSVRVPRRELEWSFTTSGGAGGQHANRNATRAELRFDIESSTAFSEAQRARLVRKLGREVRVAVAESRSQSRNRDAAERRLAQRLREGLTVDKRRTATKPTKGSQRRLVDANKQRGQIKRQRQRPTANDW
jgi:ribosome-associated protein